jgi:hypothetical protein
MSDGSTKWRRPCPRWGCASPAVDGAVPDHRALHLAHARSGAIAEVNGRATLFLGAVSSALIALAFIGQISRQGSAFYACSLIVFPVLLFLGVATFERAVTTTIQNALYPREINRIRHCYTEVAPEAGRYFILSTRDDAWDVGLPAGAVSMNWQSFLTTAGALGVVNNVLAGVLAALALTLLPTSALIAPITVGIVVFLVSVFLHQRYQVRSSRQVHREIPVLFPTPALNAVEA